LNVQGFDFHDWDTFYQLKETRSGRKRKKKNLKKTKSEETT